MAWVPSDLTNAIQDALDEDRSGGDAYNAATVDGLPVLKDYVPSGDLRAPRGKRCYSFDGVASYVSVPATDFGFGGAFTVTIKVRSDAFGNGTRRAIGQGTTSLNFGPSTNGWWLGNTAGFFETPGRLDDGLWHTVSGRCDGGSTIAALAIFIDGVNTSGSEVGTFPGFTQGGDPMFIGARSPGVSDFLSGEIATVSIYKRALLDAELAFLHDGTGVDPGTPDFLYHCNEEDGTDSFDSASKQHGTITNSTLIDFHAVDDGVTSNPANQVGFSFTGGTAPPIIPRDESTPANDVLGSPLQFAGKAPLPMTVNSPVGTWDSIAYLAIPALTGSETVSEFVGTATPTISAGRIDFTAGSAARMVLSNGWTYTFDEGAGDTIHNVVANANHGTVTGANLNDFWANRTTGEVRDHCIEYGGSPAFYSNDVPTGATGSSFRPGATTPAILMETNGSDFALPASGGSLSISWWFKWPGLVSASAFFWNNSAGNMFLRAQMDSGRIRHRIRCHDNVLFDAYVGSNGQFNDNEWHHACTVITRPANTFRCYVDGVLLRDSVAGWTGDIADQQLWTCPNPDLYFLVDEMKFFARELSIDNAEYLFNSFRGIPGGVDPGPADAHITWDGYLADDAGGRVVRTSEETYAFAPGLLDGTGAAGNRPLAKQPGRHGNLHSRLVFDNWSAPELGPVNYPAESPPGELLRQVAPINTKFRSEQNPTELADGTPFSDGDNRLATTSETLTSEDLANMLTYIQRQEVVTFLPAWARHANHTYQSFART